MLAYSTPLPLTAAQSSWPWVASTVVVIRMSAARPPCKLAPLELRQICTDLISVMALPRLFFRLATLVTLVVASGLPAVAVYQRSVPQGWSLHRRADPDALLPLKFSLVQSNLHNLEAYLLDIADPASPNYGKHWSAAKVADTFRPSKSTVDVVHSWLAVENGISLDNIELNRNGDALHVNVTIAEAERILGTTYNVYRHGETGAERVGCHEGYALPEDVAKHVDIVWPTVHFGNSVIRRRESSASSLLHVGHESGATTQPISVRSPDRNLNVTVGYLTNRIFAGSRT